MATLPISKIIHKHDTEANWQAYRSGYVPAAGEIVVYDRDESRSFERIKIGDGVTTILNLPFISDNEVYIGAEEPTEGQRFWIDTDEESAGGGTSGGITMEEVEEYVGDQLANYSTTSQMQYYVNTNTRKVYTGPTTLYIDPDYTLGGDSTNTYPTLLNALSAISNCEIRQIITIEIASSHFENSSYTPCLWGVTSGAVNAAVVINGNGATINSSVGYVLNISNCAGLYVRINNLNIVSTSTSYSNILAIYGPTYVELNSVSIIDQEYTGNYSQCVSLNRGTMLHATGCKFYSNATTNPVAVNASFGCQCFLSNNRGNCDYKNSAAQIWINGTVPSSTSTFNPQIYYNGQFYYTGTPTVDKG